MAIFVIALLSCAGGVSPLAAQTSSEGTGEPPQAFGDFGLKDFGEGNFGGSPSAGNNPLRIESFIVPAREEEPALFVVRAKMATGWHVYSLTQEPGGPPATRIAINENDKAKYIEKFISGFKAEEKPEVRVIEDAWPDLPVEEHYGQVTWTAPIEFKEGVDPAKVEISGELSKGQVCHDEDGCKPFSFLDTSFAATLATEEQIASVRPEPPQATGEFVAKDGNPVIRGHIEPKVVAPGETAKLVLTVQPETGWHVYERKDEVPEKPQYLPTILPLVNTSGLHPRTPAASSKVVEKDGVRYQEGKTSWVIEFPISQDKKPGKYRIEGYLGYSVCNDRKCLPPQAVEFRGEIEVGAKTVSGNTPLGFNKASYGQAKQALTSRIQWADKGSSELNVDVATGSINYAKLPLMIAFSLLGGLILNLMPCVLPVIGLKILSFAEQAGQSRAKVFGLNLAYSIGLLSVFFALASLAVFLNLSWGEQFTSTWFNVAMCGLVFAMALSFLGVWEIPLPGFVGGEKVGKLEAQEGPSGAFFKGVLTTLLATPCSGPFLGPVFGFTLNQPWIVTYIIFGSIGLGMALPYLLIGVFPSLVKFLPKPGAWMNTFKQIMGFVLLGTVVFLFSFMNKDYLVATFAMLVGIWFACWWVGRTPLTASARQRVTAWGGGILSATAVGIVAFTFLVPKETKIPWQPYSPAALAQAQAEGKTVMVDYTADWCLTCKTNLKFAINTEDVYQKVEEHDVVPLLADWTDGSKEIKRSLEKLNSNSIPVLAIYPANRPGEVIVLRDLISQSQVLEALEKAGPSASASQDQGDTPAARTAMRPSS